MFILDLWHLVFTIAIRWLHRPFRITIIIIIIHRRRHHPMAHYQCHQHWLVCHRRILARRVAAFQIIRCHSNAYNRVPLNSIYNAISYHHRHMFNVICRFDIRIRPHAVHRRLAAPVSTNKWMAAHQLATVHQTHQMELRVSTYSFIFVNKSDRIIEIFILDRAHISRCISSCTSCSTRPNVRYVITILVTFAVTMVLEKFLNQSSRHIHTLHIYYTYIPIHNITIYFWMKWNIYMPAVDIHKSSRQRTKWTQFWTCNGRKYFKFILIIIMGEKCKM